MFKKINSSKNSNWDTHIKRKTNLSFEIFRFHELTKTLWYQYLGNEWNRKGKCMNYLLNMRNHPSFLIPCKQVYIFQWLRNTILVSSNQIYSLNIKTVSYNDISPSLHMVIMPPLWSHFFLKMMDKDNTFVSMLFIDRLINLRFVNWLVPSFLFYSCPSLYFSPLFSFL